LLAAAMSEACGVQVGVRIRPFNEREKNLGAQLCVEVSGPVTILQQPPGEAGARGGEPKKFAFDASFWSHDGFVEEEGGYLRAEPGGKYADQALVFDTFGRKILDNAWEGYHCCLFAYGQTGSGKSYSMVGYGANKGIVPLACEEIFRRIGANKEDGLNFEVMCSMVEIYNENVQDLLLAPKLRPKKGLELRESQQLGIYIDGVQKRAVDSYSAIEGVVEEGTSNRSVGSTLMNATSSRAHTVLSIEFKQVSQVGGRSGVKVSLINLVDLAGSEKAGQTGASGDRLKEGCAINKSLSALGNVIEKLADKATGKAKASSVIPYRDSKLTRLLQNALGGSSKTVMICAISPASSNYEETLSTLRYADRAKRIKNVAVVNENPQDKIIRQLREENTKLKDMVGGLSLGGEGADPEELKRKQAEISALEDALKEMEKSFSDRLAEARKQADRDRGRGKADLTQPHIANLNEDQLLTNKLQFAFKAGCTRIGRGSTSTDDTPAENEPEVVLAGVGIHQEHAVVENDKGTCTLTPVGPAAATTFVNGASPAEGKGVVLKHADRVVLGQCIFVFIDPSKGTAKQLLASGDVSHAMARKELAEGQGEVGGASEEELAANRRLAEELERRAKEAESAKLQAEAEAQRLLRQREDDYKRQIESLQQGWEKDLQDREQAKASGEAAAAMQARTHAEELAKLQAEFQERQHKAEEAAQRRIEELERKAQKAAAEEEDHRQHELNMRRLEEQLMFVMPLVKEANLIAVELNRPQRLETKMQVELDAEHSRGAIHVTAAVCRDGVRLYEWPPETLENRVYLLRELLQRCEEEGLEVADGLRSEDDPLWDPIEVERKIGVAQLLLEGLLLQVENQLDAKILSTEGKQTGTLRVEVWPVAKDGSPGIPDEDVVEDPQALLGSRMAVLLRVPKATGLPETLANDVRVEYDYFIDEQPRQIPPVPGHCCDPDFNYETTIVQDPVTSRFLEYLRNKTLLFRVYGHDSSAAQLLDSEAGQSEAQAAPEEGAARDGEPSASADSALAETCGDGTEAQLVARHAALRARMADPQTPTAGAATTVPESPEKPTTAAPTVSQVRRQQEEAKCASTMGKEDKEKTSKVCAIL